MCHTHKKPQRTAISMLKIVHIKMPQYRISCMCRKICAWVCFVGGAGAAAAAATAAAEVMLKSNRQPPHIAFMDNRDLI